jgi:hypothetical protein
MSPNPYSVNSAINAIRIRSGTGTASDAELGAP